MRGNERGGEELISKRQDLRGKKRAKEMVGIDFEGNPTSTSAYSKLKRS